MPEGIWMAGYIGLWLLLLAESAMLLVLSRHMRYLFHTRSLFPDRGADASREGPALRSEAPLIEVTDLDGQMIRLGGPAPQRRLLVFLAPHCPACRLAIRSLEMVPRHGAQIVLVWTASRRKARELAEEYQIRLPMVADEDLFLRQQFRVMHVPLGVVVDEEGRVVAKAFAQSVEHLESLLASPGRTLPEPTNGSPAPATGPLVASR